MPDLPAKPPSSRVSEFLKRATATMRIAFIIDATGSRRSHLGSGVEIAKRDVRASRQARRS